MNVNGTTTFTSRSSSFTVRLVVGKKMNKKPMIFTKWIWVIPLFVFFITMIYGTFFYETPIINNTTEECVEQYYASTRLCP